MGLQDCFKGTNPLKYDVSTEEFEYLRHTFTRSLFGIPQKNKADIKKMLPVLKPTELEEDTPTRNRGHDSSTYAMMKVKLGLKGLFIKCRYIFK